MDKKEEGLPYPQMKQPSIDSTEVLSKDGKINWNLVECMHDADLEYVLSLDDQGRSIKHGYPPQEEKPTSISGPERKKLLQKKLKVKIPRSEEPSKKFECQD